LFTVLMTRELRLRQVASCRIKAAKDTASPATGPWPICLISGNILLIPRVSRFQYNPASLFQCTGRWPVIPDRIFNT
jgi:hypothetical protein